MDIRRGARSPTVEELRHIAQGGPEGVREVGVHYIVQVLAADQWSGNLEELEKATSACSTYVCAVLFRQQMRGWLEISYDRPSKVADHSPDFASVIVAGTTYRLTPQQRQLVQILWDHWERSIPEVSGAYLQSALNIDRPIRKVLGSLLGTLIVKGQTQDTYQLHIPDGR